MGIDPFKMGFEVSMMSEDKKKLFALFEIQIHSEDEYRRYIAIEDELAFLMAVKKGAVGPLMEVFKAKVQFENMDIKKREKKLKKKVFRLHRRPGSTQVEKMAAKLYKGCLKKYVT